jgi:hypothetical protein
MGLMVEIANVRSNPRFSMLRDLTENVGKAMELTAGLLDWLCSRDIGEKEGPNYSCPANRCKAATAMGSTVW